MMVAYSFHPRFAGPILDGIKPGTIRAPRARHARPGEEVQLYVGMRTRSCRLLARKTCRAVHDITIRMGAQGLTAITIGDGPAGADVIDLDGFARLDGFAGADDMQAFWRTSGVFVGVWVLWDAVDMAALLGGHQP